MVVEHIRKRRARRDGARGVTDLQRFDATRHVRAWSRLETLSTCPARARHLARHRRATSTCGGPPQPVAPSYAEQNARPDRHGSRGTRPAWPTRHSARPPNALVLTRGAPCRAKRGTGAPSACSTLLGGLLAFS